MFHHLRRPLLAAALAAVAAPAALLALAGPAAADDSHRDVATVYTQTNAAAGNEIVALSSTGGSLHEVARFATGGTGTGSGLGSQGAVFASDDRLLAVNAGSNSLSLFHIGRSGTLDRTDVEPTSGVRPVSVTVHDNIAYVVNAGDRTVSGFRIRGGSLVPIAGSVQNLPGNGAAQISFDSDGRRLVVTEKTTQTIDVLPVRDGVAGAAVSNPSTGPTPFGFAIDRRDHVIVSNAVGGGASSVSSYGLTGRTGLTPISSAVGDTQSAACWIALSSNGRYAYTTNAASGSISSYTLAADGSLALANAQAALPGGGAADMVVVGNTLFARVGGSSNTVQAYTIASNGALTAAGQVAVQAGVQGLAATS
jgi:6-phosphogluconolactonase